jgi:hypothetical protein
MKQKDFIFTMMAILLAVVVLLLVSPSVCGCNPGGRFPFGLDHIMFGPGPVHLNNPAPTGTAVSAGLAPQVGPVGTVVTIQASGFTADNTIEMNGLVGGAMKDVVSTDGKTLTFTVPASLGPDCKPMEACPQFLMLVTANTYKVSVVTGSTTLDVGTFTVIAK